MNSYVEPGVNLGENILTPELTKKTVAKRIHTSTGHFRHYVKSYRGRLLDPNSNAFKKDELGQRWMYVNEEIYGLYLKYLRTGQTQFLNSAERKL
jgi:hypothetical protein